MALIVVASAAAAALGGPAARGGGQPPGPGQRARSGADPGAAAGRHAPAPVRGAEHPGPAGQRRHRGHPGPDPRRPEEGPQRPRSTLRGGGLELRERRVGDPQPDPPPLQRRGHVRDQPNRVRKRGHRQHYPDPGPARTPTRSSSRPPRPPWPPGPSRTSRLARPPPPPPPTPGRSRASWPPSRPRSPDSWPRPSPPTGSRRPKRRSPPEQRQRGSTAGGSPAGAWGGGGAAVSGALTDPPLPPFLQCVLQRESGGDYQAVSPDGLYRGGFQFAQGTWNTAAQLAGLPQLVGVLANTALEGRPGHARRRALRRRRQAALARRLHLTGAGPVARRAAADGAYHFRLPCGGSPPTGRSESGAEAMTSNLSGRSLLKDTDLSKAEFVALLDLAAPAPPTTRRPARSTATWSAATSR